MYSGTHPVNLYVSVMAKGMETTIIYSLDQHLFRRNTGMARQCPLTECQFADDVALMATSCKVAEEAIISYHLTAKAFGLTFSTTKTKFMVVGYCM